MTAQPKSLNEINTAGTHDGAFHADDVMAGAALRRGNSEIKFVRTRNAQALAGCDIRFDVGGQFGPADYDHHQKEGAGVRENGIPYAAAGLIWQAYGADLCGSEAVAAEVDRILMQQIDAVDNGVMLWNELAFDGVLPVTVTSLLGGFNPTWQEGENFNAAYEQAVTFAALVLERSIANARAKVEAPAFVRNAIMAATDPRLLVFSKYVGSWQEVVIPEAPKALFVVFPSAGSWRLQTVPTAIGKTDQRKQLPEAWAGADSATLSTLTGVVDATFCHKGRFIAGAKSRDGALKLAELALVE